MDIKHTHSILHGNAILWPHLLYCASFSWNYAIHRWTAFFNSPRLPSPRSPLDWLLCALTFARFQIVGSIFILLLLLLLAAAVIVVGCVSRKTCVTHMCFWYVWSYCNTHITHRIIITIVGPGCTKINCVFHAFVFRAIPFRSLSLSVSLSPPPPPFRAFT